MDAPQRHSNVYSPDSRTLTPAPHTVGAGDRGRLALEPSHVAIAVAGAIAFIGAAGAVYAARPTWFLVQFDLDREKNVAAVLSALFLAAAAGALLRLRLGLPGTAFAALLVYAALDEFFSIHESLEHRLEIDWQELYLPGFIVAAIFAWLVFARMPGSSVSRRLFVGCVLAWVTAQVLEFVQWDGDRQRQGYTLMMVPEEIFEMTGSAMLLVAFLYAGSHPARRGVGLRRAA